MRINENLFHRCVEKYYDESYDFIHIYDVNDIHIIWGASNNPYEDISKYPKMFFRIDRFIQLSREIIIDEIDD